jgi:hypothetical protein
VWQIGYAWAGAFAPALAALAMVLLGAYFLRLVTR